VVQEHVYLPLGGLDVGHVEDQKLLPVHPAAPSAGHAHMEPFDAGVAAPTRPAAVSSSPPAAQMVDVAPLPGQHGTAGQLMQLQQLPGPTGPLGGPMAGGFDVQPGTGAFKTDTPAAAAPRAAAPAGLQETQGRLLMLMRVCYHLATRAGGTGVLRQQQTWGQCSQLHTRLGRWRLVEVLGQAAGHITYIRRIDLQDRDIFDEGSTCVGHGFKVWQC